LKVVLLLRRPSGTPVIKGTDVMQSTSGTNSVIIDSDYTTQNDQWVIIEGCKAGSATNGINLQFEGMINPYIVKTTDPF
jgi:hypothetical protein